MPSAVKFLLIAAVIALSACATPVPLQRADLTSLSRDVTPIELDRALGKATVLTEFEITIEKKSYFARHYNLQTSTRQDMTMVCAPYCMPIVITVPVYSEYVVIQNLPSKVLHAWGTFEELSKDIDPAISSIMPAIKLRIAELKEIKKKA